MVKNPLSTAGDGFNPWAGISPGEGNGNSLIFLPGKFHGKKSVGLQSKGLQKGQTQLSNKTTTTTSLNIHGKKKHPWSVAQETSLNGHFKASCHNE